MSADSKTKNFSCGGVIRETNLSKTVPLAGCTVELKNVQALVCEVCDEVYFDGPTLLKLESTLLNQPALW